MSLRRLPGAALPLLVALCGAARGQPAPADQADPILAALRRERERLVVALERMREELNEVMGKRVMPSREPEDDLTQAVRGLQRRQRALESQLPTLRREALRAESWYESVKLSHLDWIRRLLREIERLMPPQPTQPAGGTAREPAVGRVPAPPPPSPALEAALGQTGPAFNLQATPLPEALAMVRRAWKVEVVSCQGEDAVDPAQQVVTLRAPALPLRAVLDLLTLNAVQEPIPQRSDGVDSRARRLGWEAQGDRIVISSRRLRD